MRFPRSLALGLFLVPGVGLSQSIPAGAVFSSVQSRFTEDLRVLEDTRGENDYNPADINAVVERAKTGTLDKIPPADTPLRAYVERKFPGPIEGSRATVPAAEASSQLGIVAEILARLTKLPSFHLDLIINSTPPNARFELVPPVGTPVATTTNSHLSNVYRGEYEYVITKAGYKTIRERIDLIDRSGNTLDCELQPQSQAESALPCRFR